MLEDTEAILTDMLEEEKKKELQAKNSTSNQIVFHLVEQDIKTIFANKYGKYSRKKKHQKDKK